MSVKQRILVLFLICLFYSSSLNCSERKLEKGDGRHFLALLAQRNGYKPGLNYIWKSPPIVFSPIIILPATNQQQSVNIQSSTSNESFQEIDDKAQVVANEKLIANFNDFEDFSNNTVVISENLLSDESLESIKRDFRQADKIKYNTTEINYKEYNSTTANVAETEPTTLTEQVTTEKVINFTTNNPYPPAIYNNTMIDSLTFTIMSSKESQTQAPNEVKTNFTTAGVINLDVSEIDKKMTNDLPKGAEPPSFISMNVSKSNSGYPYPAALYNNTATDQLSITTNSYTNEESLLPPAHDDRWHNFSSLDEVALPTNNGFKPLAGLYYDGFLHRPIYKKRGFVPYMNSKFFVR